MEYTGINKDKEEFVPRKSKEEFFRDGEVIEELYKFTYDELRKDIRCNDGLVLQMFNYAYRICWLIVTGRSSVNQIDNFITFAYREERDYILPMAFILLSLNRGFYPRMNIHLRPLYDMCYICFLDRLINFTSKKKLLLPINFRTPFPEPKLEPELDILQAKKYIMGFVDKVICLKKENEDLVELLQVEKAKREEVEKKIKTLQKKLDGWENDPFYKAVNINTIFEYVQSKHCSENNREAIRNTLLYLCANKVPNDVIEKIKTLKLGGTIYVEKQENHGCQNFYGDFRDSSFLTK